MASFNGRLYVFDENNIYRINPQTLQIEDTYEGIGCFNQNSVVVSEYGMFFASPSGVYWHDGSVPKQISSTIWKSEADKDWSSSNTIYDIGWKNLTSTDNLNDVRLAFDSANSSILCFITSTLYDDNSKESIKKNYIWSYSYLKSRWDLWELSNNQEIGQPFYGRQNEIYVPIDSEIVELGGGSKKSPFIFGSIMLSMGQDSLS